MHIETDKKEGLKVESLDFLKNNLKSGDKVEIERKLNVSREHVRLVLNGEAFNLKVIETAIDIIETRMQNTTKVNNRINALKEAIQSKNE
jgi:hypothetical protein